MSKTVSESQEEDDNFNIQLWRQNRSKTQPIHHQKPQKQTAEELDGKKTKKYSEDPIIVQMMKSIIRQSDRYPEDQQAEIESNEEVKQIKVNLIVGTVKQPHLCTQEEKQMLGLAEQSTCMQFQVNSEYTVVVIGRLGYLPIDGHSVQLYIPRQITSAIYEKQTKTEKPVDSQWFKKDSRIYIKIQRKHLNLKDLSLLDYPCFVIDPVNLLYPTYLCSWIDCKRRISLASYVIGDKSVNQHTVYGSTCHRLLQWFSQNKLTIQQYKEQPLVSIKKLYVSMLYDMFLIGKTFDDFLATCRTRLDNITKFYENHIINHVPLTVEVYNKLTLKIEKIIESQIMIRSTIFGLKGKIDLLLYGQLIDGKNNTQKGVYISMQLKTGRRVSDSHKRQTDIYNILVKEKYKKPVIGLLYYSDSDIKFFRYEDPLAAYEIVIAHRNHIAQSVLQMTSKTNVPLLPPFPQSLSQCSYCQVSTICELSYKCIENEKGTVDLSYMPSKHHQSIKSELDSLRKTEVQYISRWFKVIHLQQQQQYRIGLKNVQVNIFKFKVSHVELSSLLSQNMKKTRLEVIHRCLTQQQLTLFDQFYRPSFKMRCIIGEVELIQGCKVVETSVQPRTFLFKMTIEMNNEHVYFNQNKLSFMVEHQLDSVLQIQTFANFMFPNLRAAVLDLVKSNHAVKQLVLTAKTQEKSEQIQSQIQKVQGKYIEGLNSDQESAFSKATSKNPLCLIEGMPGTGKTELILRLIHYFYEHNLRVLITTYTNRSLDNILERLVDSNRVDKQFLIREGSQYAVSTALKEFAPKTDTFGSIDDYRKYYGSKRVWFVTLASLHIHHLPDKFDVVIMDQASQSLEPSCIPALLRGSKFIMIGDYLQLQPLVKSKEAIAEGMGVSLFERWCTSMPEHKVSLKKQYRMNQKIMALSNQLVYNGELQLATKQIQNKRLKLPENWRDIVPLSFQEIIDPNNSIVFLSYDPILKAITRTYTNKEKEIRKVVETELPAFILKLLYQLKLPPVTFAVIAALNISVNRIKQLFKKEKDSDEGVLTIDKSQGIDKQVVVLLIEKANEDLVQNPRRLNVALTRAKSKLIIIGSEEHLSCMKVWRGSLAGLLREYQMQLTKAMLGDMLTRFQEQKQNK